MFKRFILRWSGRPQAEDKQATQCAIDLLLGTTLPIHEVRRMFLDEYPKHGHILESMIEDIQAVGDHA